MKTGSMSFISLRRKENGGEQLRQEAEPPGEKWTTLKADRGMREIKINSNALTEAGNITQIFVEIGKCF